MKVSQISQGGNHSLKGPSIRIIGGTSQIPPKLSSINLSIIILFAHFSLKSNIHNGLNENMYLSIDQKIRISQISETS